MERELHSSKIMKASHQDKAQAPHRVAILAYDGVIPFDLATPCEVFRWVFLADGRPGYEVVVCSEKSSVATQWMQLETQASLQALEQADTVIAPGVAQLVSTPESGLQMPWMTPSLREALHKAKMRGTRIVSICTGAFVLAAAGLLDGLQATTHWRVCALLQEHFPDVRVNPDVLYVDEGQILTSAGAAAGMDLCLHLVRCDYGSAVASEAAKTSVMPLERDGGQAQFIVAPPPIPDGSSLEPTLRWMEARLHEQLKLDDVARRAGMSVRSLNRHFRAQTGTTPHQWLLKARIRRAQVLLETTSRTIDRIALDVGFASSTSFRTRFREVVATSPSHYRKAFRSREHTQSCSHQ